MFGNIFGKRGKVPLRHRSSAYMNLAHQILPTISGTFDTTPAPLAMLTDGNRQVPITTAGVETTAAGIVIDLGMEYEVYEIKIHSGYGGGYLSVVGNTGTIELAVEDAAAAATTLDTQNTVSTAYVPITLHYQGNGIPVRKILLQVVSIGADAQTIKPSEIEVFGC